MVAQRRSTKPPVEPIRIRAREACIMLSVGLTKFGELLNSRIFTLQADPRGRGRGKPLYVFADEIKLFAETNDPDKVREYRRLMKRLDEVGTKEKRNGRSK